MHFICEYKNGGADPFIVIGSWDSVRSVFGSAFEDLHGGRVLRFSKDSRDTIIADCIDDIDERFQIYIVPQHVVYGLEEQKSNAA